MARRRFYEEDADQYEPQADDALQETAEGGLVGQLGVQGCRARACGDFAVVEF